MLMYSILLFTSPFFLLIKNCCGCKYRNNHGIYLLFILLSIILIMRADNVGTDTSAMMQIYMTTLSQNMSERTMAIIAPVYYIYSYVLYSIFPFPQSILIFNGLLTLLCIFYFIRRF